jgi:hypothetical protein
VLWRVVGVLVLGIVLGGSLGAPFQRDEIPFNAIARHDFTAIAVAREAGPASASPLVVKVHVLGDAADADLSQPIAWLRQHANVEVVRADDGAPLYLTRLDLSATSGRATIGATIPTGMAVEVSNPRVAPCVVAHELLHFLGLTHVADPSNIMFPECAPDHLRTATLDAGQRAQVDAIDEMLATTPTGVLVWATRS